MSRDLPAKPSLEFLRKQAKQLQRTMLTANCPKRSMRWPAIWLLQLGKLKSHVITLGLPPAEALKAADIARAMQNVSSELLESHSEFERDD